MSGEITEHMLQLKKEIEGWHRVPVPPDMNIREIEEYLDETCQGRYYWDYMGMTTFYLEPFRRDSIRYLYLEEEADHTMFRLTWLPMDQP
jgi:hypothetical protein